MDQTFAFNSPCELPSYPLKYQTIIPYHISPYLKMPYKPQLPHIIIMELPYVNT